MQAFQTPFSRPSRLPGYRPVMELLDYQSGKSYYGETVKWYRFVQSIDADSVDVIKYSPTCPFSHSGSVLIRASSSDSWRLRSIVPPNLASGSSDSKCKMYLTAFSKITALLSPSQPGIARRSASRPALIDLSSSADVWAGVEGEQRTHSRLFLSDSKWVICRRENLATLEFEGGEVDLRNWGSSRGLVRPSRLGRSGK